MSGNKQRESNAIDQGGSSSTGADQSGNARGTAASKNDIANRTDKDDDKGRDKGVRKQRASDLGRALRSIYDDTLRESVPDDFTDLLGKLN